MHASKCILDGVDEKWPFCALFVFFPEFLLLMHALCVHVCVRALSDYVNMRACAWDEFVYVYVWVKNDACHPESERLSQGEC